MIYYSIEHAPAHYIFSENEPMCFPTVITSGKKEIDLTPEELNECHYAILDLDSGLFSCFSRTKVYAETMRKGLEDESRDLQVVKIMFVWG